MLDNLIEEITYIIKEAGEIQYGGNNKLVDIDDLGNSLNNFLDSIYKEEDIDACESYIGKKIANSIRKVLDKRSTSRLSFSIIDEYFEDFYYSIGEEIYFEYEESFLTKDGKFSLEKCLKNKSFWEKIKDALYEFLEYEITNGKRSGFINFETYDKKYINYIKKKMIEKIS